MLFKSIWITAESITMARSGSIASRFVAFVVYISFCIYLLQYWANRRFRASILEFRMQEILSGAGLMLVPEEEYSEAGRGVYPDGLFQVLVKFHNRYKAKQPKLRYIITENGMADACDIIRRPYLVEHLLAIHSAIQQVWLHLSIRSIVQFRLDWSSLFSSFGHGVIWCNSTRGFEM